MKRRFTYFQIMWLAILFMIALPTKQLSAQYCMPTYNYGCFEWGMYTNNVYTTGATMDISNLNSGWNVTSPTSIPFFQNKPLIVYPNQTFSLNMQAGGSYPMMYKVWIDWNCDGDFLDAAEMVYNNTSTSLSVLSTSIIVPSWATSNETRMRVMNSYWNALNDPCQTNDYGETEDYPVKIYKNNFDLTLIGSANSCSDDTKKLVASMNSNYTNYKWYRNNMLISGANTNTYTPTQSGSYYASILNSNTLTTDTSNHITINIYPRPAASTIMAYGDLEFCAGDSILLEATGDANVNYQWMTNIGSWQDITGATTSTRYFNQSGNVGIRTWVNPACPSFTEVQVQELTPLSDPVVVSNNAPLLCNGTNLFLTENTFQNFTFYKWYKDDVLISTTTDNYFEVTAPGDYKLVAGNKCDTVTSNITTVINEVMPEPIIGSNVTTACFGENIKLNTVNISSTFEHYQWLKDGVVVSEANDSTYFPTASGSYKLITSNNCTSDTSAAIVITVKPLPTTPAVLINNGTICYNAQALLHITEQIGATYQWQSNSGTWGDIIGQTNDTLTTNTASLYRVVASLNGCSSNSNGVTLNIIDVIPATALLNNMDNTNADLDICEANDAFQFFEDNITPPLYTSGATYTWYKDGISQPDYTNLNWMEVQKTPASSGNYYLKISNTCETVYTDTIHVLVRAATAQPVMVVTNQAFCQTSHATIYAQTSQNVTFQWQNWDGTTFTDMTGETNDTLTSAISGEYRVMITGVCDMVYSEAVVVTKLETLPAVTLTISEGNSTFCDNGYAILQSSYTDLATYSWYKNGVLIPNQHGNSMQVNQSGYYQVKIENLCNFDLSDSIQITANATTVQPILTIANDTICYNQTTSITTQQIANATYQWFKSTNNTAWTLLSGQNANAITVNQEGFYKVKTTLTATGCTRFSESSYVKVIGQILNPSIDISSPEICEGTSVNIWENMGGYQNYQWYRNGVALTFATNDYINAYQGGNYYVQVSNACQVLNSDTINLIVHVTPAPPVFTTGPTTLCSGDSSMIIVNNPNHYDIDWKYSNGGPSSIIASNVDTIYASNDGEYTALYINHGCSSSNISSIVNISHHSGITALASTMQSVICAGEETSIQTSYYENAVYAWYRNGILIPNESSTSIYANQAGDYTVQVSSPCETITSNTVNIEVLPSITGLSIHTSGDIQSCAGGNVNFSIPMTVGQNIVKWYIDGVLVDFENDSLLSVNTNGYAEGSYNVWATIQNTNGCSYVTEAVSFSLYPAPVSPNIGWNYDVICVNSTVQLYSNSVNNTTYQWYRNDTLIEGATIYYYSASQAGEYTLKITNAYGCSSFSSPVNLFNSTAEIINNIEIVADKSIICNGNFATITAPIYANASYYWIRDGIYLSQYGTSSHTIQTGISGSYSLEIDNECNYNYSNNIDITLTNSAPQMVSIIPLNGYTTICPNGNRLLSLNNSEPEVSYTWYRNGIQITNVANDLCYATLAGSYTVVATNDCGSTTSTPVVLTMATEGAPNLPTITSSSNTIFCSLNGSVDLSIGNAQSGVNYIWLYSTDNSMFYYIGSDTTVQADTCGYYMLIAENGCGQSVSSPLLINAVSSSPDYPYIESDGNGSLCNNQTTELYVGNMYQYQNCTFQWYKNGIALADSTNTSITVSQTGNYTVAVSNLCGASFSNDYWINATTQNTPAAPIISALNGQNYVCSSVQSTMLMVSSNESLYYTWSYGQWNGSYYDWNDIFDGQNVFQIPVFQAGVYKVIAQNTNGCETVSEVFEVEDRSIHALPLVDTHSSGFCQGDTAEIFIDNTDMFIGATYSWSLNGQVIAGATDAVIPITQSGNYQVIIENTCGSIASQTFAITFVAKPTSPTLNIQPVTTLCSGETIDLLVQQPDNDLNYQWYASDNGLYFNYITSGTEFLDATDLWPANHFWYYVLAFNSNGCSITSDTVQVMIVNAVEAPIITSIGNTQSGGTMLAIMNPLMGGNYQWFNGTTAITGATATTYEAMATGYYHVALTTPCGNAQSYNYYVVYTGVESAIAGTTSIYPNPASEAVFIDLTGPANNVILKVYNSIGQIVTDQKIEDGTKKITIDVKKFSPGIYYFELSSTEGSIKHKIVIMN